MRLSTQSGNVLALIALSRGGSSRWVWRLTNPGMRTAFSSRSTRWPGFSFMILKAGPTAWMVPCLIATAALSIDWAFGFNISFLQVMIMREMLDATIGVRHCQDDNI